MTRFGSLVLLVALATGLPACGSGSTSTKDPLELAPADNTVAGWIVNTDINKSPGAQPRTATTEQGAEALIDGAATPFYKVYTPKEFLWQDYVDNSLAAAPDGAYIVLYIWEMESADQASGLYASLLQESEYTGHEWEATSPTLGAESRIEDTVTAWWINFHQDVFYVEVMLTPSYGPSPDFTPGNADLKNEAMRFAQAISSKI